MRSNYVIGGIVLMAIGVLLPIFYFVLDLLSLGILTMITLGFDWVCCCGVSPTIFIIGLVFLIVGLVKD